VCGREPVQLLYVPLFVPNFNHDKEVKVRVIVKAHALIPHRSQTQQAHRVTTISQARCNGIQASQ
jgi:hypothetical protein